MKTRIYAAPAVKGLKQIKTTYFNTEFWPDCVALGPAVYKWPPIIK